LFVTDDGSGSRTAPEECSRLFLGGDDVWSCCKPRSVVAAFDLLTDAAVEQSCAVDAIAVVHWGVSDDTDRRGNSFVVLIHKPPLDVGFKERLRGIGMVETEVCARFKIRTKAGDESRNEDVKPRRPVRLGHLAEVVEFEIALTLRDRIGCRNVEDRGLSHCQL